MGRTRARRLPAWTADGRRDAAGARAAADADYAACLVRLPPQAGAEWVAAYVQRWREVLELEAERAASAARALLHLRSALGTMGAADPRRTRVETAVRSCEQIATVTVFEAVERVWRLRVRGWRDEVRWMDLVVRRDVYVSRTGPRTVDRRWNVLATHLLTDDRASRVRYPGDERGAAMHKIAKTRHQSRANR